MITTLVLVCAVLFQGVVSLAGLSLCLYSIIQVGKQQQSTLESALRYLASRNATEKIQADVVEKAADRELETVWSPDSILEPKKKKNPIIVHDPITGDEIDISGPGWEVL